MRILITGAGGRLGRYLAPLFPKALTPTREELDVRDLKAVESYIKKHKPNVVIHLAAIVSPPECEKNKKEAWRVNVLGTMNVVDACRKYSPECYFVLMSTPCIFDGNDETPKDENYIPYPDHFYGLTKVVQEVIVARSGLKYLIVRGNFVPYEKWPYPKAFVDRKSNYLFAHQMAKAIKEVMDAKMEGVVHIVGDRVLSMYELALMCPDSKDVKPMTYEEYYKENPTAVKLTKSMVLKSTRWKQYSIEKP